MNPKDSIKRICEEILSHDNGFRGREKELFDLVEKMSVLKPDVPVDAAFVARLRENLITEAGKLQAVERTGTDVVRSAEFGLSEFFRFLFVPAAGAFAAFSIWSALPGPVLPISENLPPGISLSGNSMPLPEYDAVPKVLESPDERPVKWTTDWTDAHMTEWTESVGSAKSGPTMKRSSDEPSVNDMLLPTETPIVPTPKKEAAGVETDDAESTPPPTGAPDAPADDGTFLRKSATPQSGTVEDAGTTNSSFSSMTPANTVEPSYAFTGTFPKIPETALGYKLLKNGEKGEDWEYPLVTDREKILTLARMALEQNAPARTQESEISFTVEKRSFTEMIDPSWQRFMLPSLVFTAVENVAVGTAKWSASVVIADVRRGTPATGSWAGTSASGTVSE